MITIIASVAQNRVIGKDGEQPLYLKGDLKRFRELTTGHPVVMGRKTFEAIYRRLGKALPNRANVVVTNQADFVASGAIVCRSIDDAMTEAAKLGKDFFVIGGGQIFNQTIGLADKLEMTEIKMDLDGNVLFPQINSERWVETSRVHNEENGVKYDFASYLRK